MTQIDLEPNPLVAAAFEVHRQEDLDLVPDCVITSIRPNPWICSPLAVMSPFPLPLVQ